MMKPSENNSFLKYSGLGTQMIGAIGLGIWGGIKLDDYFQTNPLWTVVLSLTGLGASLYIVIREVLPPKSKK